MLKERTFSAVIMAVVFIAALTLLPWVGFVIFAAAVFLVGAWEWANLSGLVPKWQRAVFVMCIAMAAFAIAQMTQWTQDNQLLTQVLVAACIWWAVALLWVQGYPSSTVLWQSPVVKAVIGFFVLIPAWLATIYLHQLEQGLRFIFIVVLAVACADIGAYFFGRRFGKRKLKATVSPGKSWEGVWGGVFVAGILAFLLSLISSPPYFYTPFIVIMPIALVSVLGDLLESMFKRHAGLKDSGSILPGHGGVLDRIDGLVAAVPVYTILLISTGWGH